MYSTAGEVKMHTQYILVGIGFKFQLVLDMTRAAESGACCWILSLHTFRSIFRQPTSQCFFTAKWRQWAICNFFPSMAERSQAEVSPLFCLPQEVLEKILLCLGGDWRSLLAVADTCVCLRPRLHIYRWSGDVFEVAKHPDRLRSYPEVFGVYTCPDKLPEKSSSVCI